MQHPLIPQPLSPKDAPAIAKLHVEAFKGFFLTSLGENFLKAFYAAVLQHPLHVGVGIFENNKLLGFAIGTQQAQGFYTSILKRNFIKLGLAALPALLKNPLKIKRLLVSLRSSGDHPYPASASLLSICVNPQVESKGLGKQLLQAFEKNLLELNLNSLILFTDSQQNIIVNKFYKKNNYIFVRSFLQGPREMNLYYKKLN